MKQVCTFNYKCVTIHTPFKILMNWSLTVCNRPSRAAPTSLRACHDNIRPCRRSTCPRTRTRSQAARGARGPPRARCRSHTARAWSLDKVDTTLQRSKSPPLYSLAPLRGRRDPRLYSRASARRTLPPSLQNSLQVHGPSAHMSWRNFEHQMSCFPTECLPLCESCLQPIPDNHLRTNEDARGR